MFSIHFEDENIGWIAGSGIILHTSDGGLNWTTQIKNDDESYRDISFSDKNNGWVVGKWNVIRHTTDGGKTWVKQKTNTDAGLLTSIAVQDNLNATAVGWNNIVVQTNDGGKNWVQRFTPADSYHDIFGGVHFLNKSQGWIVGLNGTVMCTFDSGRSWSSCGGLGGGAFAEVIFFDSLDC